MFNFTPHASPLSVAALIYRIKEHDMCNLKNIIMINMQCTMNKLWALLYLIWYLIEGIAGSLCQMQSLCAEKDVVLSLTEATILKVHTWNSKLPLELRI